MRAALLACSILSMSLLCACETSTSINQSTANANSTINANATAQTSPVTDAASTRNFVERTSNYGKANCREARVNDTNSIHSAIAKAKR
jgi:hypothetical protein